jgi:hypothetical protein
MPLETRNIAKGVPPRVHLPKPKPSAGKKNGTIKAAPTQKNHKRYASTGGDESEEQSKHSEPKVRKKKRARHEATTSEDDVEVVADDNPVPEPPMEQVNDMNDDPQQSDEVSTIDYITQRINQLTG